MANDGKYYKYNMEINGNYYCPGNTIISAWGPRKLEDPESQILMDYFILDIKNKELKVFDTRIKDSFMDDRQDLQDAKINIKKSRKDGTECKIITIQKSNKKPITIEIDDNNQILSYEN